MISHIYQKSTVEQHNNFISSFEFKVTCEYLPSFYLFAVYKVLEKLSVLKVPIPYILKFHFARQYASFYFITYLKTYSKTYLGFLLNKIMHNSVS